MTDLSEYSGGGQYPVTYVASAGWRWGLCLCGLTIAGTALVGAYVGLSRQWAGVVGANLVLLLDMGLLLWALLAVWQVLRYRLTLEHDAIKIRGLFRSRRIERVQIADCRLSVLQGIRVLELHLHSVRRVRRITLLFAPDRYFQNWFAGIENPDAVAWEAAIRRIETNAALGADPAARRMRMRHVFLVAQILQFLPLGVLVLFFWTHQVSVPACLFSVLLVLPWILAVAWPGIFSLEDRRISARVSLLPGSLFSSMGLGMIALTNLHLREPLELLWIGLVVSLLLGGGLVLVEPDYRRKPASLVLGALFWAVGVTSMLALGNCLADRRPGQSVPVEIEHRYATHGKGTAFHLLLSPGGPLRASEDVTVGAEFYRHHLDGDRVCVVLHSGALGLPWYAVQDCAS